MHNAKDIYAKRTLDFIERIQQLRLLALVVLEAESLNASELAARPEDPPLRD
jgi:hypothetical protein